MAILAIAGLSIFTTARQKAKDTRMKNDVKAAQQAVEQQFDPEAEVYPAALSDADFEGGSAPDEVTYSTTVALDGYCIISDPLNTITAGNCSAGAAGVCTWASDSTNFCAANVQQLEENYKKL